MADRNRTSKSIWETNDMWKMRQVSTFSVSKKKLWSLHSNSTLDDISIPSSLSRAYSVKPKTPFLIHVGTIWLTDFLLFFRYLTISLWIAIIFRNSFKTNHSTYFPQNNSKHFFSIPPHCSSSGVPNSSSTEYSSISFSSVTNYWTSTVNID